METTRVHRRGFLGRIAAVAGGLAGVGALAQPARAGRSRWRRFGGWGYGPGWGYRRGWSGRRFYGGWGYGGYGYGPGFGYGGYGPGFGGYGFGPGFGGFGYGPGFYGGMPGPYYGNPGIYLPLDGPARAKAANALSLLET